VPGGLGVHILLPLLFVLVPTGHKVHVDEPSEENEPGKHFIQALESIELVLLLEVPAGHSVHMIWPDKLLYEPARQARQLLSLSLYVPSGQAEQLVAPELE